MQLYLYHMIIYLVALYYAIMQMPKLNSYRECGAMFTSVFHLLCFPSSRIATIMILLFGYRELQICIIAG